MKLCGFFMDNKEKILCYDIQSYSGRRMQIQKLMEELLVLNDIIKNMPQGSNIHNRESKKDFTLEKYRLQMQIIEQALATIRALQSEDRLKQNLWKAAFGIVGAVVGFVVKWIV